MTATADQFIAQRATLRRIALPGARDDRLYFAQVREDARLELEVLNPSEDDAIVVVSSGGCTALSLLAAGAGGVAAVDLNRAQNHLVELKVAACAALDHGSVMQFLGATRGFPADRRMMYAGLVERLTPGARAYWDSHLDHIEAGVINAGVTERFIRVVVTAMRMFVHRPSRIDELFACDSIAAQRDFFVRHWNTRRWRALFGALLNPVVFRRAYDPAFFDHLEKPSFAEHFRQRAAYTINELPVRDNYFLQQMFRGYYPADVADGVPAYLSTDGVHNVAQARERLTLVDAAFTDYLRTLPEGSITGFVLSNIAEWLTPMQIDELFGEVARTAAPNAKVCFRNFVGWTDVPERWRDVIVEDRARGEALMMRDRSVVQRRFAVCTVRSHAG